MKRKVNDSLPIAALVCILIIFFWRFLFLGQGYGALDILYSRFPWSADIGSEISPYNPNLADFIEGQYPSFSFLVDIIKGGKIPFWNPYTLCGSPAYAFVWLGIFSPLTICFLVFPLTAALNIMLVLQLFLAGLFMYLFLRSLKVGRFGGLVAAIAFMFNGFFLVWLHQLVVVSVGLWLPLLFLLLEKSFSKESYSYAIGSGIVLCLVLISGMVQISLYILIAIGLYFIFRVIADNRYRNIKGIFQLGRFLLIALIIAFSLSAIQLIPFYELANLSHRPNISYSDLVDGVGTWRSLPWSHIITIVMPDFFGNPVDGNIWDGSPYTDERGYVGVFVLMLAIMALFFRRDRHTVFFGALAVISLLWALGTPLYAPLYFLVPGVAQLRSVSRIILLFNFSIAILAGFGADLLIRGQANRLSVKKINKGFVYALCGLAATVIITVVYQGLTRAKSNFLVFYNLGDQYLLPIFVGIGAITTIALYQRYGINNLNQRMETDTKGKYNKIFYFYIALSAILVIANFILYLGKDAITSFGKHYIQTHRIPPYQYSLQFWYDTVDTLYLKIINGVGIISNPGIYLPLLIGIGVVIMMRFCTNKRIINNGFKLALLILISFDLMHYGMRYNTVSKKQAVFPKTESIRFLKGDTSIYRILPIGDGIYAGNVMPPSTNMPYKIQSVSGFGSLYPKRYAEFMSAIERRYAGRITTADRDPSGMFFGNVISLTAYNSLLLDMLNVKYILTEPDKGITEDKFELVFDNGMKIYRNKGFLSRAFIVPKAKVMVDKEKILVELLSKEFNPKEYVILEDPKKELSFSLDSRGFLIPAHRRERFETVPYESRQYTAEIQSYEPHRVVVDVKMTADGFLVLGDSYYPGWKAYVDGKERAIYRANYIIRAVQFNKGIHRVEFVYDPLSFKIGMFFTVPTGIFILIFFASKSFRKRCYR